MKTELLKELSIVVADGDASTLRLLERHLTKAGFRVFTCADGNEALILVQRHKPAILLFEWNMPGINGPELCSKILESEFGDYVHSILVTSNTEPEEIAAGINAGVNGYLVKPIHSKVLLARVRAGERILQLKMREREYALNLKSEIEKRKQAEDAADRRAAKLERQKTELDKSHRVALSIMEDAEQARKGAEATREALRESEEKFRTISATAQDAIIMIDSDGSVSYWNDAAEAIFGYTQEEVMGEILHASGLVVPDRFHEAHNQAWPGFQHSGLGAAVGKTSELVGRRKDGTEFPLELSLSAVKIKEQWHAIGMLRDITKRKFVEAELRKLSVAVEQSPALIVITNTQGTIEYVNPMFTEVTGYTAEEAIGQNPRMLKGGKRPKDAYKKLWDTILDGKIWTGTFENRKKNGELYWEEASICPIRDAKGSVTHFIAVKQDITERKKAEKSLRRTEAELRKHRDHLEELVSDRTAELAKTNSTLVREVEDRKEAERVAAAASRAKGDFLATMSHELRTPLNGVLGMMELLLRSELNKKQRRHAQLAKLSGDTLLTLINDILDFSKIEAGKLDLETMDFDLRHTVESLKASLVSRAEGKGLELICSVHPEVPVLVRGDSGRLQQILINLAANAIKFTEHGQVVVRASKDDETEDDVTVRFTVTDTGIGIPHDRCDRLFQSFSQVDSSTTRKYGGTGLGLAISKRLAELMGGEIGVESEPGRGSTFWFTVKIQRQATGDSQSQSLYANVRGMRILAVDDNPTNCEILAEQLSSIGFKNETASSGEQALLSLRGAAKQGDAFGLAILDMQMPGMNGEVLAQAIKADPSLEDTCLMLLTSGNKGEDDDRLKLLGFSGWLTKPVSQSRLLDEIIEALACANAVINVKRQTLPDDSSPLTLPASRAKSVGARILLAEDNEINAEAAVELLSMSGYQCQTVTNGKKAVQAVLEGEFDLILMDCQMPEMDGFEATRTIRRHEKNGRLHRGVKGEIPIVALTANAIKGDRERCLESGMDDYLTKPLNPDKLVDVIENLVSHAGEAHPMSPVDVSDDTSQKIESGNDNENSIRFRVSKPFDLDAMSKRWGGNSAFIEKLIDMFCNQAPLDLEKLEQAIIAGDVVEATRLAHGLKGAAAYVSADAFRAVAIRLEEMGRASDMNDALSSLNELRAELEQCLESNPNRLADVESQHANTNR